MVPGKGTGGSVSIFFETASWPPDSESPPPRVAGKARLALSKLAQCSALAIALCHENGPIVGYFFTPRKLFKMYTPLILPFANNSDTNFSGGGGLIQFECREPGFFGPGWILPPPTNIYAPSHRVPKTRLFWHPLNLWLGLFPPCSCYSPHRLLKRKHPFLAVASVPRYSLAW